MKIEKPPYTIAPEILFRIEEIGEAIGRATGIVQDLRLRRINRILTVRGSLAIEGNILSEEQVSTILDGKPVVAPLLETPVCPHPRRKSGACPTKRLLPSHPAEFGCRREYLICCVHAGDHSGRTPPRRPWSKGVIRKGQTMHTCWNAPFSRVGVGL